MDFEQNMPNNSKTITIATAPIPLSQYSEDQKSSSASLDWNNEGVIDEAVESTVSKSAGKLFDSLCEDRYLNVFLELEKHPRIQEARSILAETWLGRDWANYSPENITPKEQQSLKNALEVILQGDMSEYLEIISGKGEFITSISNRFEIENLPTLDNNLLEKMYRFGGDSKEKLEELLKKENIPEHMISIIRRMFSDHNRDHIFIPDRKNFIDYDTEYPNWEKAKRNRSHTIEAYYATAILNTLIMRSHNSKGINNIEQISRNMWPEDQQSNEILFQQIIKTALLKPSELQELTTNLVENYASLPDSFRRGSLVIKILEEDFPALRIRDEDLALFLQTCRTNFSPDNIKNGNIIFNLNPDNWENIKKAFYTYATSSSDMEKIFNILSVSRDMYILSQYINGAISLEIEDQNSDIHVTTTMIEDIQVVSSNTGSVKESEEKVFRSDNALLQEVVNHVSNFDIWLAQKDPEYYKTLNENWDIVFKAMSQLGSTESSYIERNLFKNPEVYKAMTFIFHLTKERYQSLNNLWEEFCDKELSHEGVNLLVDNIELKNGTKGEDQKHANKEYRRMFNLMKNLFVASRKRGESFSEWTESGLYKYFILLHKYFRMESHIFIGVKPDLAMSMDTSSVQEYAPNLIRIGRESGSFANIMSQVPLMEESMKKFLTELLSKNNQEGLLVKV